MMKAHNKNRKHPTCSRCRFHGKKDIRVLQHQCPFRNCTCSSCFLIKRRSIIYRAQKNLDKTEDTSNSAESPVGSGDGSIISNSFNDITTKSGANCSISRSSDSSSDATNYGTAGVSSEIASISSGGQPWKSSEHMGQHSGTAATPPSLIKSSDHYKISDFQSLCLTFPELTATQLQSIFEQCGNDFQRTIDRVLMNKWCQSDIDSSHTSHSKPSLQSHNNNDWSTTCTSSSICGDYASNTTPFTRSTLPSLMAADSMSTHFYNNSNNSEQCYDWRSNSSTGALNDDLSNSDYGNDYYYDQSSLSCAVMSTQGNNHQAISAGGSASASANWNYDYTGYWYNNLQGNNGSNGNSQAYEMSTGSHTPEDMGWPTEQNGPPLALGQAMHEYNI